MVVMARGIAFSTIRDLILGVVLLDNMTGLLPEFQATDSPLYVTLMFLARKRVLLPVDISLGIGHTAHTGWRARAAKVTNAFKDMLAKIQ